MLAPMPLAATLGIGPLQQPTVHRALARPRRQRDHRVARARAAHAGGRSGGDAGAAHAAGARSRRWWRSGARRVAPPLRLATVFPVSMHTYELRYWLAASGIRPDRDVELLRGAAAAHGRAPRGRRRSTASASASRGARVAAQRGSGAVILRKHDIWQQRAREGARGERRLGASGMPSRISRCSARCSRPRTGATSASNRAELAHMLASGWVDAPRDRACCPRSPRDGVHHFHALRGDLPVALARGVDRHADAALGAAREGGRRARRRGAGVSLRPLSRGRSASSACPSPAGDEKPEGAHDAPWHVAAHDGRTLELGPDLFIDGRRFDSHDPAGYLAGFEIAELRASLDEIAVAQRTGN